MMTEQLTFTRNSLYRQKKIHYKSDFQIEEKNLELSFFFTYVNAFISGDD